MSMSILMWAVASLAGLVCAVLGCARVYQRKISLLQQQYKADRLMAVERYHQARHQIGLLQAELAQRPPALRRAEPAESAPCRVAASLIDRVSTDEDGFAKTLIGAQGFLPTQLMT